MVLLLLGDMLVGDELELRQILDTSIYIQIFEPLQLLKLTDLLPHGEMLVMVEHDFQSITGISA